MCEQGYIIIGITPSGMIRLRGLPPYGGSLTREATRCPVVPPLSPAPAPPITRWDLLDRAPWAHRPVPHL